MVSYTLIGLALCASSGVALRGRATKSTRASKMVSAAKSQSGTKSVIASAAKSQSSTKSVIATKKHTVQAISYEWAKESFPAVGKLSDMMKSAKCGFDYNAKQCHFNTTGCTLTKVDAHKSICSNLIEKDKCEFLSYGTNGKDVWFDQNLAKLYGCKGIALNPAISPPTKLLATNVSKLPGTNVTFKQIGAPVLMVGGKAGPTFKVQSPTETQKELQEERISVLKMDCLGCEYAIASSVLKDDPKFFHKVDQFALKVHVDDRFLSSQEHLHEYNRLLQLIDESGLQLVSSRSTGCGNDDKDHKKFRLPNVGPDRKANFMQDSQQQTWGLPVMPTAMLSRPSTRKCLPELSETGYDCNLNCQNFLFARPAVVEEKKVEEKKDEAKKDLAEQATAATVQSEGAF